MNICGKFRDKIFEIIVSKWLYLVLSYECVVINKYEFI